LLRNIGRCSFAFMNRLAALLLLPLAATAGAHDLQDPSERASPPGQDPALTMPSPEDVEATLLALGEIDQRLTVPVAVGTSGPYNFIIDTGAERTVVSANWPDRCGWGLLAGDDHLDDRARPGQHGAGARAEHQVDRRAAHDHRPGAGARDLGALGLLGIDTLRNHQVTIDFEKGTMAVRPSVKRSTFSKRDRDEIVVTAKSVFGQLIVTDAYYDNTRIQVVLDTGSQVTMGNSALRRRVGHDASRPQKILLTSVTGDQTTADYTQVPGILIGQVRFGSMPVAFADVRPFERFGLVKRPALLLGMDALRSFRRVEIDFPNRQVRFLMPKAARPKWAGTGSMLPGGSRPGRSGPIDFGPVRGLTAAHDQPLPRNASLASRRSHAAGA
jgi:predicted aspartyl protease